MLSSILIATMITITSSFILIESPLLLGGWIILLALMVAAVMASLSTWLGLMVFLIYVGGLLVMFSYFVALTPNIIIGSGSVFLMVLFNSLWVSIALTILHPSSVQIFSTSTTLPLQSLINESMGATLSIGLVLFLSLVAVVKICSGFSAPLRPYH